MAEPEERVVKAVLRDGEIIASIDQGSLHYLSRGYGEKDSEQGIIRYSYPEALYLVEEGRMRVLDESGEELTFNQLLESLERLDENVWRDYVVYRDLRKRRYVVKDGFSKSLRFRVFDRGKYGKEAAKYIVAPIYEGKDVEVEELMSWLSASRNMRKELVIAVVDRRNEVIYYRASLVDLRNV